MTRQRQTGRGRVLAAGLALCAALLPAAWLPGTALAQDSAQKAPASAAGTDVLIMRKGDVRKGTILAETATTITFKSDFEGIGYTTEILKADILEIKRGAAAPAKPQTPAPAETAPALNITPAASDTPPVPASDKTRYTYMTLSGKFGEDISQSPIRKAMREAINAKTQVIIVEVDNDWKMGSGETAEDAPDAVAQFDQFHRAEKILQVFAEEMPDMARDAKTAPPRLVFWVRRAMGGAAFLPLISNEIYFHPEGKIGGIGNLATMLKGHERVVEKQISLRLKRAIGWVNLSGYPYAEELVRAMTQDWYVCSVKFVNGKPVLFEGTPGNPSEELLTDDAKEGNRDTIDAIARNEGNDVLTLNERNAKLIGVSRGTVESKSDLLAALRLDRAGVEVGGRPEKVMTDWREGLVRAFTQLKELWREYREVQVTGDFEARRKARSTQIQKLEQIKALARQWGEGLNPREVYRLGIPLNGEGEPDTVWMDNQIEKIKMAQRLDRR